MDIQPLLALSSARHTHLCPRQVLGVRCGLAGLTALGFDAPPDGKRLLAILETDGCFADGVEVATHCTVGHRTLRLEDYGKIAVVLVDVKTELAVRVAPRLDVRQRALAYAPGEPRRYFAQLQAYQIMPNDELLSITQVQLVIPAAQILSRPSVRVTCEVCGEEIINQRELVVNGQIVCRACAGQAYYRTPVYMTLDAPHPVLE